MGDFHSERSHKQRGELFIISRRNSTFWPLTQRAVEKFIEGFGCAQRDPSDGYLFRDTP